MTVTIPSKLTNGKELVVIPLEEYNALMTLRKVYEFQPTATQKRILAKARKNRVVGKVLTLDELRNKMGFGN